MRNPPKIQVQNTKPSYNTFTKYKIQNMKYSYNTNTKYKKRNPPDPDSNAKYETCYNANKKYETLL